MWVTYFRNLEKEQSYFQYVCSFLEPVKNANNVSYEIDKISFSQEESLPIKVYNLENQELICYCIESSEVDEFKDLDGKDIVKNLEATVSLDFIYDSDETFDKNYSDEDLPICESTSYQSCKELVSTLSSIGISVESFWPSRKNTFFFKIKSKSLIDLISDVESFKFAASTAYRGLSGKFFLSRSLQNSFFEIKFDLNKNLTEKQEKFLKEKYQIVSSEKSSFSFVSKTPSPNSKIIIKDVLSILSS